MYVTVTYISWSSDFAFWLKRLFVEWVSYFQIMRQVTQTLTSKYSSIWPTYIFHGLVILLNIFKIIWCINIIIGIMNQCDTKIDLIKYVGQWPLFHAPVILLHILKTIWWRNVVLEIMDQCDTKIDLLKYMLVSDLYFMVHWFCLLSLSLTLIIFIH